MTLVTERDKKLLRLLFEHRCLSLKEIKSELFPETSLDTIRCRLKKLEIVRLLKVWPYLIDRKYRALYEVTQKGLSAFQTDYPFEIKGGPKRSDSVFHDLKLFQIRKAFGRLNMVEEYYTESVLQTCGEFNRSAEWRDFVALNSDAAIRIKSKNENIFGSIEYESAKKAIDRYRMKLRDYYTRPNAELILYVCENKETASVIQKVDIELSAKDKSKLFFAQFENVIMHPGKIIFSSAFGSQIVLQ